VAFACPAQWGKSWPEERRRRRRRRLKKQKTTSKLDIFPSGEMK